MKIREMLGTPFIAIGGIVYAICALIGFIISLMIVSEVAGFWGVVLGITLFPVVLVAAPWYALVSWGNPIPLILIYGGGILAAILYGIGRLIYGSE